MGILIDIVVISILLLNIIMGYKKGVINAIFSICTFLIAIVITLVLYKPVSNIIIENTDIKQNIKTMIINNNKKEEEQPQEIKQNNIYTYIENAAQNVAAEAKDKAVETMAETIATKAIEIITCVILFILTRIILIVLKFLTKTIEHLPIIKQCNEIGGLIYGILKGLIIIYLILTVMFLVISIRENGTIANAIEQSYVTKFFYNNNIIVNYCFLGKNLL